MSQAGFGSIHGRRRRTGLGERARRIAGPFGVVAILAAGVLLFLLDRHEPLPQWMELPADAVVEVSLYRPAGAEGGPFEDGPGYFARIRVDAVPELAAAMVQASIREVNWDQDGLRAVCDQDMARRRRWPAWLRQHAVRNARPEEGWTVQASGGSSHVYVYAWPAGSASIVEVVRENLLETGGR